MEKKLFDELIRGLDQMRKIHSGKIKARRTWVIPPVTKVKESAKKYSRTKSRKIYNGDLAGDY